MSKWTRERIIRDILRRESEQLPLFSASAESGVDHAMYQAASRIFGSWKNAVVAAGLPASRARANIGWTPARIKKLIRSLARRKRPLAVRELKDRYGHFVAAARRYFGSWSKAVIAAGIDPSQMRSDPRWTSDRIIEMILTRALRGETLERRAVQPASLTDAATRAFGSWKAAMAAAGVSATASNPVAADRGNDVIGKVRNLEVGSSLSEPVRQKLNWTDDQVISAITERFLGGELLYATAVYRDRPALYRAAARRFGNWRTALISAGLDPAEVRKAPKRSVRNKAD